MYYYEVAPTRLIRPNAATFTYHSNSELAVGTIVKIPVGKSSSLGVVMEAVGKPTYETREISAVVTSLPLPSQLTRTAQWMSEYYATHLSLVLTTLLPRGIDKSRRSRPESLQPTAIRTHHDHTSTPAQAAAIEQILTSSHTTHLLHGVTGSGKTHVYKKLVAAALDEGKSAIILVPEIALTSQVVDEFRQTFGEQVLLTHSRQTEAERHITWQQALEASAPRVVIGPRSALFLPLRSVGLIVIDEMHEPSYKQEQSPRYSALRVATVLASHHGARAVFGSATPPVAEYYATEQAGAPIITLPARADSAATPPTTHVVDMTKRDNFLSHRFLSNILLDSLQYALNQNQQVLLFHNRRGSTSTTLCEKCGWIATDPETGIPLTLHADTHQLISHASGYQTSVPTSCPVCGAPDIIHKGIGTKLIESEIRRLFPNKKVVRFDGDTGKEHSVEARYQELYDGDIDIIIGTQVIAKGIDLPHLTAVGIIQADAGLSLPDFTSQERVFQLIHQTVGRVGRNHHATTVIVQSYQPTHLAVRFGAAQNYADFLSSELQSRRQYTFPPYSYLLKFICTYKTEKAAIANVKKFAAELRVAAPRSTLILGPTPAFYEKQGGSYRWQITVRSPRRADLLALTHELPANGHWQYELDPVGLLS